MAWDAFDVATAAQHDSYDRLEMARLINDAAIDVTESAVRGLLASNEPIVAALGPNSDIQIVWLKWVRTQDGALQGRGEFADWATLRTAAPMRRVNTIADGAF